MAERREISKARPRFWISRAGRSATCQGAFYHLYYESELRPIVLERWQEHSDYDENDEEPPFEFRNEVIQELWKEADDDVKEEVAEYIKKEYEQAEYGSDIEVDEDDTVPEDEQAQRRELRQLQS